MSKKIRFSERISEKQRFLVSQIPGLVWLMLAFPGRLYVDVATTLQGILEGEVVSNWTIPHYYFIKISSLNGSTIFLTSLIHVVLLQWAVVSCYRSLFPTSKLWLRNVLLINSTPYVSLFAITNTKDVFFAIGLLSSIPAVLHLLSRSPSKFRFVYLLVPGVGLSFSNIGLPISIIIFVILFLLSKNAKTLLVVLPTTFFFMLSIAVPHFSAPTFLGLSSFMGDVKCVVQNPNNELSSGVLLDVQKFGPLTKWQELNTCRSSDYSFFAASEVNENPMEFVKLWAEVFQEAPYTTLMARIQRSSNFLPPILFPGPSNSFEADYSLPVGVSSSDKSLLIAPQLFYPGQALPNDSMYQLWNRFGGSQFLEIPVIVIAFVFNQNSSLLGWTGLWLFVAIVVLFLHHGRNRNVLLITLPHLANHVLLILAAPAPEPRYAMGSIIFSMITLLGIRELKMSK